MTTFLSAAGALALVKALIDLVKYVVNGDKNGWVTQLSVWSAGVATTWLVKASDVASSFDLGGGVTLDNANVGTTFLAGLGLGSAAMLANEFKKALDRTDTATKPDLWRGSPDHE